MKGRKNYQNLWVERVKVKQIFHLTSQVLTAASGGNSMENQMERFLRKAILFWLEYVYKKGKFLCGDAGNERHDKNVFRQYACIVFHFGFDLC